MKIFISWSGERSHALAAILHERLPYILQYLDPWLSQSDIDAGDRWATEVAKELEVATFGVTCLTAENVASPWILFEAGALAKSMQDGRVVPLLLDLKVSDVTGPLAQFQAKKAEKAGLLDVVQAINKVAPNPVPDGRLKPLFEALWPDFEKAISDIPKTPTATARARPQGEILEELVDSVRSLDGRYRDMMEDGPISYRRRRMRYDPMLFDEVIHRVSNGPSDPFNFVMVASLMKEDFPWMYELGVEAYRAIRGKDSEAAAEAVERFQRAFEMLRHGPFLDAIGDKRTYMMIKEMSHFLKYALPNSVGDEPKPVRPRPRIRTAK